MLGRDLYSGIIYGTRLAMVVGLSTVFFSLLIGVDAGRARRVPGRVRGTP